MEQNNIQEIEEQSFNDIISSKKIRIPKIQRDYAQGRINKEVKEIRKSLVHNLMLVVKGKTPSVQLDFVYGSDRLGAFEPLDGQQRLTTLFLLHWVLGVDLRTHDGKEAVLTYETRSTTEAFCKELVKHSARQFVEEAEKKSNKKEQTCTPSEIIKARDWFQWSWNSDPSISSMLVMIDAICNEMDWALNLSDCQTRLKNITFDSLDLGELGMSDELFIKMNARGKQLSDFDKMKSTLEEELQLLQQEKDINGNPLATMDVETKWRTCMDGKWIDLFWKKYASNEINKLASDTDSDYIARMSIAEESERKMKKLILRLIGMQLFAKHPADANLYEATYNLNEDNLDDILVVYHDSLLKWRNETKDLLSNTVQAIDFKQLIEDVNLLIYKDSVSTYNDVTSLLPKAVAWKNDYVSYFDQFVTASRIGNDFYVTFYGIIKFLRLCPLKNADDIYDKFTNQSWLANFADWTRLVRNVCNNDNNTDRIDKIDKTSKSFAALDSLIDNLVTFISENSLDVYSDNHVVMLFISSYDYNKKDNQGIDNQSIDEEIDKAKLKLSSDKRWEDAINVAEQDPYLWGQIRCLVGWANGDYDDFISYRDCLLKIISLANNDLDRYYLALLCHNPMCWKKTNKLFEFNRERDTSVKRYLRDKYDDTYGKFIKEFIDDWIKWDKNASLQMFCDKLISEYFSIDWVSCLKDFPSIISRCRKKCLGIDKGHVILYELKTIESHCYDPILLYFNCLIKEMFKSESTDNSMLPGIECHYFDSKGDYHHAIQLVVGEKECILKWGTNDGEYVLYRTAYEDEIYTSTSEAIYAMKRIINTYRTDYDINKA